MRDIKALDKETIRKAYETGEGTFKVLSQKYEISEEIIKSWAKQDKDKGQPWIKSTQPKPKKQNKKVEHKVVEKVEAEEVKDLIIKEEERIPGLTDKQKLFVAEYLTDFNATRAAIAAGYSKSTAVCKAYEILRHSSVKQEIKRQTEAVFDSLGLTTQRILMEYMKMAAADIKNYVTFGQREVPVMTAYGPLKDEDGNIVTKTVNYVDFKESEEVNGTLIQEVKMGKDGASIKLYDKQKAWDTLAKYMKIIVGGVNINIQQNSINVTLEDDE